MILKILSFLFAVTLLLGCAPEPEPQPGPMAPELPEEQIPTSRGYAHLSWMPPTENTDGSVLTDLDGYDIHYGTESGFYDKVISIPNEGLTEYLIESLDPNLTYYFVITAYNTAGDDSEPSEEVFKEL